MPILMIDEGLSAPENETGIRRTLRQLAEGRSTVTATGDVKLARGADGSLLVEHWGASATARMKTFGAASLVLALLPEAQHAGREQAPRIGQRGAQNKGCLFA